METHDASDYRGTEVLDAPDISGYSSTEVLGTAHVSGYRGAEVFYTPSVSGYSRTKVLDTPDVSGYSRGEMMDTHSVSGYRGTEVLDTQYVSGYGRTEVLERQCEDTDPTKMTAEGSRHTSDTSQQPSACGEQTSILKEMFEMVKEMDNKIPKEMFEMMKKMDNKITTLTATVNTLLHLPDSRNRAFPGRVIQIQDQKKEDTEMLKDEFKKLEARYQELLAKTIAMHQDSEDINDPSHLSAVLKKYEMLRLQQWEKVRSSVPYHWTYERGSYVIEKLFYACEKDIWQRTDDILKCLDIPPLNDAMTRSKQEMMREIRKLFRQHCYQNYPGIYSKIVQDPPVKADWKMNRKYLEHVDKKDAVYWKNPSLLWPIMKRGEEIIVKGVVWDQSRRA